MRKRERENERVLIIPKHLHWNGFDLGNEQVFRLFVIMQNRTGFCMLRIMEMSRYWLEIALKWHKISSRDAGKMRTEPSTVRKVSSFDKPKTKPIGSRITKIFGSLCAITEFYFAWLTMCNNQAFNDRNSCTKTMVPKTASQPAKYAHNAMKCWAITKTPYVNIMRDCKLQCWVFNGKDPLLQFHHAITNFELLIFA